MIKPEIKVDPMEAHSPAALSNIDDFEEEVDLQIPPIPEQGGQQAWLVKVPDYIWKAWSTMYQESADNEPIEIGKMRVYNTNDQDPTKQKIQIKLAAGNALHHDLPLTYDLALQSNGYNNTVVFSEKDLPGHATGPGSRFNRRPGANASLKPNGIPSKADRYGKQGGYRTSIPKQTRLAPVIQHVADAYPDMTDDYYRHFKKTYDAAIKPKATVAFQRGIDRNMHPSSHKAYEGFNTFAMSSRPKGKKTPVREKNVRVSEQELLDRLYQCFRQYRYWSLRALKNELRQPEAFIKQTLESIATLIRSGDFAMNYKLKDEIERVANVKPEEVKEETAIVKSEDESSGEEDEDAEMDGDEDLDDFEDVAMGN